MNIVCDDLQLFKLCKNTVFSLTIVLYAQDNTDSIVFKVITFNPALNPAMHRFTRFPTFHLQNYKLCMKR